MREEDPVDGVDGTAPTAVPLRVNEAMAVPSWWQPVVLAAMAGGMGWGIRGQYGHESGAMIAGVLVSLVLVFLFCPNAAALPAFRAIAWGTVAIGFGGSMTYGQTVGLTHDAELVGHWGALRWGLLGLAIKGGIWIGFAGVFLGMGLGGVHYRARELFVLMSVALGLFFLGTQLLNQPFDPGQQILPRLYFSDDWRWEPGAALKPRRECWGGLLFALVGVISYAGVIRKDRLARNLAYWAFLGGAIGFPLGQSVQAFHAWNRELFQSGFLSRIEPHMNWWNMMETTFGAVFGAVLGFGLWMNRKRIAVRPSSDESTMKPAIEWCLIVIYALLLISGEFYSFRSIERFTDLGLAMGLLPIIGIAVGRWWPFMIVLPLTALPIAGKTLRQLGYGEHQVSILAGWVLYVAVPLILIGAGALWCAARSRAGERTGVVTERALLIAVWLYFGLNYAFFRFPWPWVEWTSRTPNGIIFSICAIGITIGVLWIGSARKGQGSTEFRSNAVTRKPGE
ncbi:MAG: hypothetical protein O2960_18570 [Verrucomicrobia bacterium]|nr:hypothetical protein [Verrucomicrobiota bacterium]